MRIARCGVNEFYLINKWLELTGTSMPLIKNTSAPSFNQDVTEVPGAERRWNLRKRSCGLEFVEVHNNDRIECKPSDKTICEIWRLRVFKPSLTSDQITSLYFSHRPLLWGLYTEHLLVATPRLFMYETKLRDINYEPLSEWTQSHNPNKVNTYDKHAMTICVSILQQGKRKEIANFHLL